MLNENNLKLIISEEDYEGICSLIFKAESIDLSNELSYDGLIDEWDEYKSFRSKKELEMDMDSPYISLCHLFAMRWLLLCAVIDTDEPSHKGLAFRTLFLTIANTTEAIVDLVTDGFDYQGNVLVRNLQELSLVLLNIMIDEDKLNAFIDCQERNEIRNWSKYFRFSKLTKTLREYEGSLSDTETSSFPDEWRRKLYDGLSSYVHNDYLAMMFYSFQKPRDEEELLKLNVLGTLVSRIPVVLELASQILWCAEITFETILDSEKFDFKQLINKDNNDDWNKSSIIGKMANYYFLLIKYNEEK